MSINIQDVLLFKPREKRTSVWSDEFKKIQSSSVEQNRTEPVENDITEVLDEDETCNDEETDMLSTNSRFRSNSRTQFENVQSNLSKLSILSDWANVNLSLLLNKFDSDNSIEEEDVPWTWDALFTEINNEFSEKK